jgi:CheY-like chemotaxis protein
MADTYLLVVEDDSGLRDTLVRSLESLGHRAEGVANGAAALAKVRGGHRRPDVIILDLKMPILSGWEFLAIRDGDPVLLMIPVILITGEPIDAKDVAPNALLSKPVDLEKLRVVVDRILQESSPDPERAPRPSEPWAVDADRPTLLRNAFDRVVAVVASDREARRVAAAVNGVSQISTAALEQGIIDKGLHCLYDLHRYDTDSAYREELDAGGGLASILEARNEVAKLLRFADAAKKAEPELAKKA